MVPVLSVVALPEAGPGRNSPRSTQRLFLVAVLAGRRPLLFHGVACPAQPVGDILAEIGDVPRSDLFPVALFAIAFQIALVRPVRKGDAVFELEDCRAIICKRGCCCEKDCSN